MRVPLRTRFGGRANDWCGADWQLCEWLSPLPLLLLFRSLLLRRSQEWQLVPHVGPIMTVWVDRGEAQI